MHYSSKILLFGEFIVIQGAQALVMPFSAFGGAWKWTKKGENTVDLQMNLLSFSEYLGALFPLFEKEKFERDLKKGLFFQSNIPTGYGLGSSGAVVAAVYSVYFKEKIKITEEQEEDNLRKLKTIFAQMESFFHGSSSGIDPLICYVNKPIWIKSKTEMTSIFFNDLEGADLFLLDTKISRSTEPLVNAFLKKSESDTYKKTLEKELFPLNNKAINQMVEGKGKALFETIHNISSIQKEYFQDMIPTPFLEIWEKGLRSDLYKLKVCGAGGGGFILGITKDFEKTKKELKEYLLIKIEEK